MRAAARACGHSTDAIAASISTMAAQSCQCSVSPSHQRARDDAEHRDQHHRQRRGHRRQAARKEQPGRLREAEDQHGVVDDRGPDRRASARASGRARTTTASTVITSVVSTVIQKLIAKRRRIDAACGAAAACRAPTTAAATSMPSAAQRPAGERRRARATAAARRRRAAAANAGRRWRGAQALAEQRSDPTAPRTSASCSRGSRRAPTTAPARRGSPARARPACWSRSARPARASARRAIANGTRCTEQHRRRAPAAPSHIDSGAKGERRKAASTPSFMIGQLRPQTSVSSDRTASWRRSKLTSSSPVAAEVALAPEEAARGRRRRASIMPNATQKPVALWISGSASKFMPKKPVTG